MGEEEKEEEKRCIKCMKRKTRQKRESRVGGRAVRRDGGGGGRQKGEVTDGTRNNTENKPKTDNVTKTQKAETN